MTVTQDLLVDFFAKEDYHYVNKNNIEFLYLRSEPSGSISVTATLKDDDGSRGCISIEICTEHFDMSEFITDFRISCLEDLDHISAGHLSDLYILKQAFGKVVCYLNGYLSDKEDTAICFRRSKDRTCIFSEELHFYDETGDELYEVSHFLQYIENHNKLLLWFDERNQEILSLYPSQPFKTGAQIASSKEKKLL